MIGSPLILALALFAAPSDTPDSVAAEVEALRVPDVAWRSIDWTPCLLEGLAASRREKKPCVLWVFIDRPVDDARC